jgi:hypothetical protein
MVGRQGKVWAAVGCLWGLLGTAPGCKPELIGEIFGESAELTASSSTSTITGTTAIVANGVAVSAVTITLRDASSSPIAGVTPTFGAKIRKDRPGATEYFNLYLDDPKRTKAADCRTQVLFR